MFSKVLLVVCVLVAVSSAVPAGGGGWAPAAGGGWGPGAGGMNPFIPPWIATAPWYPQWVPCTGVGSTCQDCTTRLVCTKVGGLARACTDPTLPYCNAGECSATPTVECAPPTPVNAAA